VRIFQRGEEGSGRTIERFARRYARRTGDASYPQALRALFDEEARHARDLGRFLDLAGIPRRRLEWSDGIFRLLRHRAGLDGALSALVSAELIARIYYRALLASTASPLLRRLCAQILRDESQHVRFQCQRLASLRAAAPPLLAAALHVRHRLLYAGAACVVAWRHRRVLGAANLGGLAFARRCAAEWRLASRVLSGKDAGAPARQSFAAYSSARVDSIPSERR